MSFQLTVGNRAEKISAEEGDDILQAVTHAGVNAPRSCKNGNCFVCEAELISGSVSQSYAGDGGSTKFLPCKSVALKDSSLRFLHRQYTGDTHQLVCQLISIKQPSEKTWQLQLRLPAGKRGPINPASIIIYKGRKAFPIHRVEIDQRILLLELNKDPALYLEHRLAYIRYQLL